MFYHSHPDYRAPSAQRLRPKIRNMFTDEGTACRAVMGLPRWKRTGGRDFVFYHSHPGFEWDDLDVTTAYQETICNDFQARLADSLGGSF